ncbi:MAG: TlpA family protein disulfide reductase [Pseudomonadota bacterium]|nr:TlpA family protein disulfide reductase [Pseudomonadota bacterium]
MKRRAIIVGSVAAGAAVAGLGAAISRMPGTPPSPEPTPDLWTLTFVTPEGAPLPMSSLRGRPLLLNFWATWCVPCATEMPLLDRFASSPRNAGKNVLALAIDAADPVRRFLRERSLHLSVALSGPVGLDLSRSLGNHAGGLPYSVVFDAAGRPREQRLGVLDTALLDRWSAI